MPRGRRTFPDVESVRNKVTQSDIFPRPATLTKPVEEKENKMQKIHHIVRTATLDNAIHDSGAMPLNVIETDIYQGYLSKGWQVLSVGVLRVGQSEFEILYTLVQNVP